MITKVVGVTFSNEDGSSRARIIAGMTESDKVCLEREPYNQYDANAVKVCVLKNGEKKQIGYLPKDIAAEVSSKLRRNVDFDVIILGVGIWNDRPYCEIDIHELVPENPISEPTVSSTRVVPGPTFKPNNPVFAPPSRPNPTFTPPTSNPKQTEPIITHTAAAPTNSSSPRQTKTQTSNTGCFGMIVFVAIVISALVIF